MAWHLTKKQLDHVIKIVNHPNPGHWKGNYQESIKAFDWGPYHKTPRPSVPGSHHPTSGKGKGNWNHKGRPGQVGGSG